MIYIDTAAFVARFVLRDQHHTSAVKAWGELAAGNMACFTSNIVLVETLTLIARRTSYHFAVQQARAIFASQVLTILRPVAEDEADALLLFQKFADQSISFADCLSFALMRKRGITTAMTFDHHFAVAGFNLFPEG